MTDPTNPAPPVEELRALLAKATQGPFDAMKPDMIRAIRDDLAIPLFDVREPWGQFASSAPSVRGYDGKVVMRANSEGARISATLRQQHANCAALLALLQHAPALLDHLSSLTVENERLREAVSGLLDLIDTADEHGDEMAIVEQAANVRSALSSLPAMKGEG